jgi:2-oxo-4-hydroxy-4-carboxy-5-ureidoimidazoline decarboxylase
MERWQRIDAGAYPDAREQLRICCGSSQWIEQMLAARPFGSRTAALSAARTIWFGLPPDEWREAFAHHPRIGDLDSLRKKYASTAALSEHEQSGVSTAQADVLQALLEGNRAYEARFGHIFIVCATGKSAGDMLALLKERLSNEPGEELRIAAEEHAKICELRLVGQT